MVRTTKRPILIVLAWTGAIGFAAPTAVAAERLAMVGFSAEKPALDREVTLSLGHDGSVSRFSARKGGADISGFDGARSSSTPIRKRRAGKALRIDLFRFQVTRPLEGDGPANPSGIFLPSVVHVGVKQGAMPGSKAVGVEMPVAPNLVVESRLGAGGESNTGVRFRLHY